MFKRYFLLLLATFLFFIDYIEYCYRLLSFIFIAEIVLTMQPQKYEECYYVFIYLSLYLVKINQ